MAKDQEVQMPSSQGGLVQYFNSDAGIELDPKMVIGAGITVAIVEVALHMRLFF